MPLDVRKVLKDMVLNSMVDKQKLVRRAAANVFIGSLRSLLLFVAFRFLESSGMESSRS